MIAQSEAREGQEREEETELLETFSIHTSEGLGKSVRHRANGL